MIGKYEVIEQGENITERLSLGLSDCTQSYEIQCEINKKTSILSKIELEFVSKLGKLS